MMRVTVSHDKGRQEAMRIVDKSIDDVLKSAVGGPVKIDQAKRQWNGSTMDFSFRAKMGFLGSHIHGKVFVEEKQLTIEVELPGMLGKFISEDKVRAAVESKARGLLTA
jgi:hypothetical protein